MSILNTIDLAFMFTDRTTKARVTYKNCNSVLRVELESQVQEAS